jgi:uncharacterized protein YutD
MKRYLFLALTFFYFVNFTSCNTATPEKYFDQAVLNVNMQFGFADDGMLRQLESPSVKLDEATKQPVPMKRDEIIKDKIKFTEEAFAKVKSLKETAETKAMLQNSIAVYEYVLPVYKNEYTRLAKLYDDAAPKDQIQKLAQDIHDKYLPEYEKLYNQLVGSGKLYADQHAIKVNWGVYGK